MIRQGFVASMMVALGLGLGVTGTAMAGDASRGERISTTCVACHGPGGVSQIPSMYPSLAGRDAEELALLLAEFREGERQEPQMSPQAQGLSDQDIKDLAAYFAAQEPE